jgi:hypothetical protein
MNSQGDHENSDYQPESPRRASRLQQYRFMNRFQKAPEAGLIVGKMRPASKSASRNQSLANPKQTDVRKGMSIRETVLVHSPSQQRKMLQSALETPEGMPPLKISLD